MRRLSRREFVRVSAAGAAAAPFVRDAPAFGQPVLTAQDVVDRIRQSLGVPWTTGTVDTFKAGDPTTVVTGIVTTALATVAVMREAVKAGANLIVTSGPTFYSRTDSPTPPAARGQGAGPGRGVPPPPPADPVFVAKNDFIRAHRLVVWRFSDHWRLRTPNPFAQGLTEALGWTAPGNGVEPGRLTRPATTLDALAVEVKTKLGVRGGMRIVGNPQARVRTIAVAPGTVAIQEALARLSQADALIAGEIREWESSEYVRDLVTAGAAKGLILIGRTLSEDAGMKVCAQWLGSIVPQAPVRWLAVGDPYWRPSA